MFSRALKQARVAPAWKKAIWTGAAMLILSAFNQRLFGAVLGFLPIVLQFAMYMSMSILQFYGIMFFLAGAKIVTVLPGSKLAYTLDDYRGNPKLLAKLQEWLKDILGQSRLIELGGRAPGGILLIGAPGTGKTYAVKCLAGEAEVPFLIIDASQLFSMWMGVGVLKVMQFASKARKHAKVYGACFAVVDEIDSVARSRGSVIGEGGGYNPLTGGMGGLGVLNRLLSEMDGINETMLLKKVAWRVIWVGCTNRFDILDKAITREGRFDIIQVVELPSQAGRKDIIEYYLNKVICSDDVDTNYLAMLTAGLAPSALEAAVRVFGAAAAAREQADAIYQRHLIEAIKGRWWGDESSIEIKAAERQAIAYHESGHAIVGLSVLPDYKVTGLTCTPHLGAREYHPTLGMTVFKEDEPSHLRRTEWFKKHIMMLLGGMCAEKIIYDDWGGSLTDLEYANKGVEALQKLGYFGLRLRKQMPSPSQSCGTQPEVMTGKDAEEQMAELLDELHTKAMEVLESKRSVLDKMAAELAEKGDLTWTKIQKIYEEDE